MAGAFSGILRNKYKINYQDFTSMIKVLIVDGYSGRDAYYKLIVDFPELEKFSLFQFERFYILEKGKFNDEVSDIQLESIFYRNLMLYDKVYRKFQDVGDTKGMIRATSLRNQLLKIVEADVVQVENILEKDIEFDFSKLEEDERLELNNLLELCKN